MTSITVVDPATLKETVLFDRSAKAGRNHTNSLPDGFVKDTDRRASQAFLNEAPETALKHHPQLASAYATITVIEKHSQAFGLSEDQQSTVLQIARDNIAKNIQHGQYLDIKIREKNETTSERAHQR